MKILIFINFIIFVIVCSDNNSIEIINSSFTSEKCYNNLNFNFTINETDNNIENITGIFLNESSHEFGFTCNNLSAKDKTLICKFNESLENSNYTFSTLKYNNNSNYSNYNLTFNYAKNYADIDKNLTKNQTINLDYNYHFKIIFKTMNVDKYNYTIELENLNNKTEKYNLTEKNITCNFGIMYIKLNLKENNYFNLNENETKNFSVNITNPCYKKENFTFYITLNRSCGNENCTLEKMLLSNQPNYTNPFFDESFFIFKSNFSLILNILLLLFI